MSLLLNKPPTITAKTCSICLSKNTRQTIKSHTNNKRNSLLQTLKMCSLENNLNVLLLGPQKIIKTQTTLKCQCLVIYDNPAFIRRRSNKYHGLLTQSIYSTTCITGIFPPFKYWSSLVFESQLCPSDLVNCKNYGICFLS